jgi:hydrogenase expression/formation protein HypC
MCLAVPGQVLSVAGEDALERTGRVSFGGIVKEVSLSLVPEVGVGDYVIVHVGVALSKVDEAEALQVFEYLKQMDELVDLEGPETAGLQNSARAASPSPTAEA